MADMFQGDPLPATVTTTQEQQTTPEFYTNYLQDIANLGQAGVEMGGVAGLSPLQQQALNMAPDAAFSGMGTMGAGAELTNFAGTTAAPDIIGNYMNPYQSHVVDEMARLQQRNIKENMMPAIKGAAGSMGSFGSSRQFNATGNMLRDMQADLVGKQYGALNTGYQNAMTGAQNDLTRSLQAGESLGTIGTKQSQGAKSGLDQLMTLGGVEQQLGQKILDDPMAKATAFSQLMKGYNIPTGLTKQTTGSTGYSNSPLAQVSSLLTALQGFTGTNAKDGGAITSYARGGQAIAPTGNAPPPSAVYTDGEGNYYDAQGYLIG
jgi:hypothetical protein